MVPEWSAPMSTRLPSNRVSDLLLMSGGAAWPICFLKISFCHLFAQYFFGFAFEWRGPVSDASDSARITGFFASRQFSPFRDSLCLNIRSPVRKQVFQRPFERYFRLPPRFAVKFAVIALQ